jgi:GntR family transcriptional regulator
VAAVPLYRRIAGDLREAIHRGELGPGSQLPTEEELRQRYGVSRNTVRLALAALANEGVISSTPGRGTFVRERVMLTYVASRAESPDRPGVGSYDAYVDEVRGQGRLPSQRFEMRVVPADASIAERLQVEEGSGVVLRRVTRMVDSQPWSLQDSYYPMDIAQECDLLVPHDIQRGTVRALADHGHVEIGYVDEITTRMPRPDEAQALDLAAGVPVLVYVRTAVTAKRPDRMTATIFAGDRNRLVYEIGNVDAYTQPDQ